MSTTFSPIAEVVASATPETIVTLRANTQTVRNHPLYSGLTSDMMAEVKRGLKMVRGKKGKEKEGWGKSRRKESEHIIKPHYPMLASFDEVGGRSNTYKEEKVALMIRRQEQGKSLWDGGEADTEEFVGTPLRPSEVEFITKLLDNGPERVSRERKGRATA